MHLLFAVPASPWWPPADLDWLEAAAGSAGTEEWLVGLRPSSISHVSISPLTAARADLVLGALDEKLGIEVVEASADRVVARMPVQGNTQSFGLLHGGATAALVEAVGSWAAVIHAGPGRTAVGVDLNVTHHRGATGGHVTATATPLHRGSTVATYAVAVYDGDNRLVCTGRITNLLREQQ